MSRFYRLQLGGPLVALGVGVDERLEGPPTASDSRVAGEGIERRSGEFEGPGGCFRENRQHDETTPMASNPTKKHPESWDPAQVRQRVRIPL
jgi:hypothetical protein